MKREVVFVYITRFNDYPVLNEYCVNLQDNGFQVTYIGMAERDEQFIHASGVKVIHLLRHQKRLKFCHLAQQLIRQIQPDLVHVIHFRGCLFLRMLGSTLRPMILDVRTVHVANKQGKHSMFTPLKNRLTWLESLLFSHAIALTDQIRKGLQPTVKKVPVIPLGASVAKFNPPDKLIRRATTRAKLGIDETDLVFLYSGTLSPIRRIDLLIDAFITSLENGSQAKLLIVGTDPADPNTLENLKSKARSSGYDSQFIFTGFMEYDLVIDYFFAADIGVCYVPQTEYYDQQPPTKLFEYIAAGLTVVATKTSANRAIISDSVNGLLSNDNIEEFGETMTIMSTMEVDKRASLAREASKVLSTYSWDNIVRSKVIPFYMSILN